MNLRGAALMAGWIVLGLGGCSADPGPMATPADRTVVRGTVLELEDAFPRDGGARLVLAVAADSTAVAYLPPIFTDPRPGEATLATVARVMAVFRELAIGDRVEALGVPTEQGLQLERLRRLP